MSRLHTILRPGISALRTYWLPIAIIQAIGLAIIAFYFFSPPFARFCAQLAELNSRAGLPGAALVSAIAGGLLPEVAKFASPKHVTPPLRQWRNDILFNLLFFAFSGAVVALFYRWQAHAFGADASLPTLAKKVAFDQFIFTVFWATPLGLTAYALHRHHYSLARAWPDINPGRLVARAPGLLIINWAFWIPMCVMIYALPSALQFPLFTCALAAWSLLLVFIASEAPSTE